jgi:hypothetical protein
MSGSLTLQNPPVPNPELNMVPGMAAPMPPATGAASTLGAVVTLGAVNIPDTSIAPVALQEPLTWTYDFDPATGIARASFPGEVIVAGNPLGGPVTGTGAVVLQTSPTINTPTITAPTVTGTIAGAPNLSGTATATNAPAGAVGEYVTANLTTAFGLTTGVAHDLTTISLTAGDWDVWGEVGLAASVGASPAQCWINTTSATAPAQGTTPAYAVIGLTSAIISFANMPLAPVRLSLAATTTVYLTTLASFASGTCNATGIIAARRVR